MSEEALQPPLPSHEDNEEVQKVFYDPVTGEQISKNAWKKLQKGTVKKEKPHTNAAAPVEKKEKVKKEKELEVQVIDNTTLGEKKAIEGIFPQTYQPKYVEAAWQSWWEKCGYYAPDMTLPISELQKNKKFVMVIPPPNVTGSLHLGHALTIAIEDTLTRWHRMNGKITLWVPGTDHAGIATQSIVEKKLKKEEGILKHDLGREEFLRRVWQWKEMYGNRITSQIRNLGASVDWSREAFTMDKNLSRAVTEAFVRFHEDGLIYRDTRLINWSCALQSAISEIEVDYIDVEGKTYLSVPNHKNREKYEFGVITSFAYKVEGSDEEIVVATTRLETMLGDTGVAVHPDDTRYKHLHGKFLKHPFVERRIPIVLDPVLVDMNFGTGAVKITPAHDPNDNACGKRHNLESIIMLSCDGKIASNGGKFSGMMRYDARVAIETELTTLNLFRGKMDNNMRLGLCSRSGDIIEPMLTPQWYVNCNSMAEKSIEVVRNGQLKIFPSMHEATWFRWLENIRDWCVSRQLWWGHRIPAYFARIQGEETLDKNDPANKDRWIVARSDKDALNKASKVLGAEDSEISLEQDEDVLDTWFSSGLFPFSVFGWPEETVDFKTFYPTELLETGVDILFFWVARMVMMGLHLTSRLPFKTVYLHAMVRDKYGRKMSKSVGNVIDPLEVINGCTLDDLLLKIDQGNLSSRETEKAKAGQKKDFPQGIPECGADALRFGLLAYTVQGRDLNLDIKRVVGYRQFCNKIWNAVKFVLSFVEDFEPFAEMQLDIVEDSEVSIRDLYILSKLNSLIVECNNHLEHYMFGAFTSALHSFFLYDFCDLYLELVKPVLNDKSEVNFGKKLCAQKTLYTCLEYFLRLLHPVMPFVTEELWQRLPKISRVSPSPTIMIAKYPIFEQYWTNEGVEKLMDILKEGIHAARSLRSDYRVPNHMKVDFYFRTNNNELEEQLISEELDFCTLARANFLKPASMIPASSKGLCTRVINDQWSIIVCLDGVIDVEAELTRLDREKCRLSSQVELYTKKCTVPEYESKVPESVRISNGEKLDSLQREMTETIHAINTFLTMKETR